MNSIKKYFYLYIFLLISIIPIVWFCAERNNETSGQRPFITKNLVPVDRVNEVHFFWTSGIEWNHISEKNPVEYIGGTKELADKFQEYLTYLLETSPKNLIFRFVTDEKTRKTNEWLEKLQEKYKGQFLIEDVKEVSRRLQERYPEFKETIKVLFLNGTQGNPAIASDAYRLIGALGGYERPPQKYRIAYCDIDTLVFGITNGGFELLFKTLLEEEVKDSGFLMRVDTQCYGDVLISSFGPDLSVFDNSCKNFLQKWKAESEDFFNRFIRRYEVFRSLKNKEDYENYRKKNPPIHTPEIVNKTGPAFRHIFQKEIQQRPLDYKSVCAVGWDPMWENEDSIAAFKLLGFDSKHVRLEEKAFKNSLKKEYYVSLGEGLYVQRRFGEDHLSTKLIKDFLEQNNPFKSDSFKKMIYKWYYSSHETYSEDQVRVMCSKCLEEIQKTAVYGILKDKLELLKIPFSLTVEELMSYVGQSK